MKTTFIEYEKDKGFWIDEGFMEIACNFIVQTFDKIGLENKPEWYVDLYEELSVCAEGVRSGYLGIAFDECLDFDASREAEFVSILSDTKEYIIQKGNQISFTELRELEEKKYDDEVRHNWTINIETGDLLQLLDVLTKMVQHKWSQKDYRIEFKGF